MTTLTVSRWRPGEVLGASFVRAVEGAGGRLVVQRQRWKGVIRLWGGGHLGMERGAAESPAPGTHQGMGSLLRQQYAWNFCLEQNC